MPREPQESATKDVVTEVNTEEDMVVTKEEDKVVTKEEALKLTFCCCVCCHCKSCLCDCKSCLCHCLPKCCDGELFPHCLSKCCCNTFPQHSTANQFFTPKMFEAYQKEGRQACEDAKAYDFLKAVCPAGDVGDASAERNRLGF